MKKFLQKIKTPKLREWMKRQKLRWGTVPKPIDPNKLAIGKWLFVDDKEKSVLVKDVKGNLADPKKFEINGEHTIAIIDFYMQIKEGRRPTQEEWDEWNGIELLQVEIPQNAITHANKRHLLN